jgi:hypothetical protein
LSDSAPAEGTAKFANTSAAKLDAGEYVAPSAVAEAAAAAEGRAVAADELRVAALNAEERACSEEGEEADEEEEEEARAEPPANGGETVGVPELVGGSGGEPSSIGFAAEPDEVETEEAEEEAEEEVEAEVSFAGSKPNAEAVDVRAGVKADEVKPAASEAAGGSATAVAA